MQAVSRLVWVGRRLIVSTLFMSAGGTVSFLARECQLQFLSLSPTAGGGDSFSRTSLSDQPARRPDFEPAATREFIVYRSTDGVPARWHSE